MLQNQSKEELVTLPTNTSPQLFDRNHELGREIWHWYDAQDGVHYFETRQNSSIILDVNTELRNNSRNQRWGNGRKVASVPLTMFHRDLAEAVREGDQKHIKNYLNDRDHYRLRTFEGKV